MNKNRYKTSYTVLFGLIITLFSFSSCEEEVGHPSMVTVMFDSDGGTPASYTVEVPFNETVPLPEYPTKAGFDMVGWYWALDPTIEFDHEYQRVNANIDLIAKWEPGSGVRYNVSFDTRGGEPVPLTQSVVANKKARQPLEPAWPEPVPPIENRNQFQGWFTDEALTQGFSFNTNISEDITLYAKWESDEE